MQQSELRVPDAPSSRTLTLNADLLPEDCRSDCSSRHTYTQTLDMPLLFNNTQADPKLDYFQHVEVR